MVKWQFKHHLINLPKYSPDIGGLAVGWVSGHQDTAFDQPDHAPKPNTNRSLTPLPLLLQHPLPPRHPNRRNNAPVSQRCESSNTAMPPAPVPIHASPGCNGCNPRAGANLPHL